MQAQSRSYLNVQEDAQATLCTHCDVVEVLLNADDETVSYPGKRLWGVREIVISLKTVYMQKLDGMEISEKQPTLQHNIV